MTPKKTTPKRDKEVNRDPTTVYPDTSPPLQRAYRIFGPGHNDLATLEGLKDEMFIIGTPEAGESWLTPMGQEVASSLGASVAEILQAYGRYKEEIERMNKADRIHEKRKQAQGDSGDSEDEENEYFVEVNANGKIKGVPREWGEDEDPLEQFWRDPVLWLSKTEALSRIQGMRASIAEMNATMRDIQRFYQQKMESSKDLDQGVERSVDILHEMTFYSETLEEIIDMHDSECPGTTWESRDQPGVTFGPKVPWVIHRLYDLDERVDEVKPVMTACKRTRLQLAGTKLLTTKKQLRAELRFRLVRFATLCLPEAARDDFKKELEEELKK